jgi:CxxC motif-containing protein (DUF1111 family)
MLSVAKQRRGQWTVRIVNFSLLVGIAGLLLQRPLHDAGSTERLGDGTARFVRGDANDDGALDLSDALFTLNYLFLGTESPPCLSASDTNDDGLLDLSDGIFFLGFLFHGGEMPPPPFPEVGTDPTPDLGCLGTGLPALPLVGTSGGPDRALSDEEALSWRRGRLFFGVPAAISHGLGPRFNGDSCVACHLDPVVGGAGGLDVDVVRFARREGELTLQLDGGPAASRHSILDVPREECPSEVNVFEMRQTPTILGLGLVDRLPDEVLLANEDPDDLDGDGISGRARLVGGVVSRFGHKAGVPHMGDFAADALANEIGLTVGEGHSAFALPADGDDVPDPEVSDREFEDLTFFLSHLAPPPRVLPDGADDLARVAEGEALFASTGCVACHVTALEGDEGPVAAYSDFLLHDVADPARFFVSETGVEPSEFRTAPLWGLRDTQPYLHDGSAETLEDAIILGHHGEALAAGNAYLALPLQSQEKLIEFLLSL